MPDPTQDAIAFVCIVVQDETIIDDEVVPTTNSFFIEVVSQERIVRRALPNTTIEQVQTEEELYESLFKLVHRFDPDILTGFEVHNASWGYLIQRGSNLLGMRPNFFLFNFVVRARYFSTAIKMEKTRKRKDCRRF